MTIPANAKSTCIVAVLLAVWTQAAEAGASAWQDTEGARLRIITEAWEPGTESLRGALQIELEPGWKTYWREPGSAGIPPSINASAGAERVTLHFPAPIWVDDAYGSWAGYRQPVSLPLTLDLEKGADVIVLDVFLGICHDICVPVTASFEVPLESPSGATLQTIQVDTAFAGLPDGNTDRLSIGEPSWTADGFLEIPVNHAPKDADGGTQLFLAAGANRGFRKPVPVSASTSRTVFRAEPLFDPAQVGTLELVATARRGPDTAETVIAVAAPNG